MQYNLCIDIAGVFKNKFNIKNQIIMYINKIKTHLILSAIILVSITIFLTGCTKEENLLNNTPVVTKDKDQVVIDRIMNFLDKVEFERQSPSQKSSEFMEIDSAVWYIEAAINYVSTEPITSSDVEISTFTVKQNIEHAQGMINMSDIQTIYDSFQSSVYNIVSREESIDYIFIADVFVSETENANISLSMTIGAVESLKVYPPVLDDWFWGVGLGKCDETGGTGTDAADVIHNRLNHVLTIPPAGAFWTDVEYKNMEGEEDDLFEFIGEDDPCLTVQEITDYIGIVNIFTTNNCPTGKQLIYREFWDDFYPWTEKSTHGLHLCRIEYGILRYGIGF
jgi:hypothetical protein